MRERVALGMVLAVCAMAQAEAWTLKEPRAWARDGKAVSMKALGGGAFELRHTGGADWSIHGMEVLKVKPGDVFRMSCESSALDDAPNANPYCLSVISRTAGGAVASWSYGERSAKPGKPCETTFMVPPGVESIEPRVIGAGRTGVAVRNFRIESLGNRLPDAGALPDRVSVETEHLSVTVRGAGAALEVTDRRTGRVWASAGRRALFVLGAEKAGEALRIRFVNPETVSEWSATVVPEKDRPELVVTVEGDGDMASALDFPAPFATRKGDRLILPMNEGVGFPVDEEDGMPRRLVTYSGHGVCMAFFGVAEDATGAGHMGIVETADDAAVAVSRPEGTRCFGAGPSWEAQKGRFGYARRIRYVFLDKGGHVAMCKRYRKYAREQGKVKTFAEKAKARPLVDRLLGAPNIWCWEGDKVGFAKKIREAGIDRFLWSAGGSAEQVAALAKMDGVLVSRYDVYRDIYRPEQLKKLGWKKGTNTDAWPEGAAWDSANSNDWRKAWGVKAKDGTWTYCGCMCDAVSAKYCRKHVGSELKTHPYNTRFIDVTTAAAWDTCHNPAHPMTRSDSRRYRMDLLRLLGDEFGLVVGSETGHDAAVPYCDYFEGMLSLCHYRVPDSGRNIQQIWTNAPPRVAKFQVGEKYRLPLWELVYHDCLCAHWYWGDYNNKLPALWDKRDLFNVLYGTMGMYIFNAKQWEADKARFVRSYRVTSPVARKTGYSEMTDHRILTEDRAVQQTVFANGVTVTVNFGGQPYRLPAGEEVPAGGYRATGL